MEMVANQIPELIDDDQGVLEQVQLELVQIEGSDEVVERLLELQLGKPRVQAQPEQEIVGLRQVCGELLIEQPQLLEPFDAFSGAGLRELLLQRERAYPCTTGKMPPFLVELIPCSPRSTMMLEKMPSGTSKLSIALAKRAQNALSAAASSTSQAFAALTKPGSPAAGAAS